MHLCQSNRLENLLTALCAVLAEPVSSVLAPELIVVQNPGMARWLSQQIALRTGICANIAFPLPAAFIWRVFEQTLGGLPDLREFSREVLPWRVLGELDSLLDLPALREISAYLNDDRDGGKRFALAGRIADLFDQYLVYRPDMVIAWEKGREQHWQARLWRQLTDGSGKHRAGVLERFFYAADSGTLRTDGLPERVCIFGINSLAPAYLEVISRISRHIDTRIFHFSPCRQAWDDIMPERLIALRRQSWRRRGVADVSRYYSTGNPLLASMGSVGREFFRLLVQMNPVAEEKDLYETPPQDSLLGQIQGDILDLRDRGKGERLPLKPDETSIRFHCCHSPMREVQVLHDRLLDLFAADSSLKPADILIMAPDISRYAAAVAGVFGSASGSLRIPWSIADQPRREEQPVFAAFLGLLALITSRCTAPEVAAVLENPVILARFAIAEQDVPQLRAKIMAAGIRWGLDQNQRRQQRTDAAAALHTWEAGLDRLLLGCLTGPLDAPWQGIMPCGGGLHDGGDWLGSLADFIRRLQQLRRQTQRPQLPADWAALLLRMISTFLDSGSSQHQDGLLVLRQGIADFARSCDTAKFSQSLSLAVIRRHFEQMLAEPAGGQAFLSGRVTFCNMVPMRSVPFKVIWLLGMNDADFPRSQHPPAFDLIAQTPLPGDRSRRDDDRYLFLEALLSARSCLAVSWLGRDQRDNAPRPPSVVAAELCDYINRGWTAASGTAADQLTVEHPLQPFSRHCFDGSPAVASYRAEWLPAAAPAPAFSHRPLPRPEPLRQIDLSQLVRFWKHPVRFFLEQRLGLRTFCAADLLPESEVFAPDHLQKYLLAEEILKELRHGREESKAPFHRRQAAGELPGGQFGHLLYWKMQAEAAELAAKLEPMLRQPAEPAEVDLIVEGVRLTGWLTSLHQSGRVTFRPASLKPNDLLQLWIQHLALLLCRPAGVEPRSVHAAKDKTVCFQAVADPQAELAVLVRLFQQGGCKPLRFYPETSYAWAKKAQSRTAAMEAARRAWHSGYVQGEQEDPAYEIALRGCEPLDEWFEELAGVFRPVLEHLADHQA